ncbi:MAG TPA: 3,4-dihydroxy-2-butanone-4-phosphate synthase [Silvibacterium sp.]|nr:3,4-dihydroxy-2-butanone-4-phosphate synthase [Silvibacterium sp.]
MRVDSPFSDIPTALDEMRAGRMVVVVDDEDREKEGDLTMAAEAITPETINFMARYGRGLICLAMTPERIDALALKPMTSQNTARFGTAFTESIDALCHGVTTGISAYDRAHTILCAIDPQTLPSELGRPGHIFPLRAQPGGVLVRAGQTEASVDLTRLAGMTPAAVICEIMNDDGTMARVPDLIEFCERHDLRMITVAELIRYRMAHERGVHRTGVSTLTTEFGSFSMITYVSEIDGGTHVALLHGELSHTDHPVLVRMHAHCPSGNIFHGSSCECAANLRISLQRIVEAGAGAVVYLHHSAQSFMIETIASNGTPEFHFEEHEPSRPEHHRQAQRTVGVGAQILRDLTLHRIYLLTDHPHRVAALGGYGIEIVGHIPIFGIEEPDYDLSDEISVNANLLPRAHRGGRVLDWKRKPPMEGVR